MIKRITLDTNGDAYGQASNLYVKIVNDEDNTFTLQYPTFTEIELNGLPTGVYIADVDVSAGKYTVQVINDVLLKEAQIRATFTEEENFTDLSDNIDELNNSMDAQDTSNSFA